MAWLFKRSQNLMQVEPSEAWNRKRELKAILVDVREPREWKSGHIPGAKHIPLRQINEHLPKLLKEEEVIFVCRTGNRSASAAATLAGAGHARSVNLQGGMVAWSRAGLPTTS